MAKTSYDTSRYGIESIGNAVDEMMNTAKNSRKQFERRWYDNNWFDDGIHFRYLSRSQNKIVDLSEKATLYNPLRAIPKASRQIRGVVNLLMSKDLIPVVYPERVNVAAFPSIPQQDPQSGQMVMTPNPELKQAQEEAKKIAKLTGHWIEEEFDHQDIKTKLMQMGLLTAKHGVSYLHIYPDATEEKIKSIVRDAFEVFLIGEHSEIEDCPFVIMSSPKRIAEIKANENYDEEQRMKINPDNRQASSEIKEAYMKARFGSELRDDQSATILLKEAYIKEFLNKENMEKIRKQENAGDILADRKEGDPIIRQCFVAGNICLKDEYIELPHYPVIDFRFEPGPIHQVPMIERFIPANKALDVAMSRIERYTNTMNVGIWTKRSTENFDISNQAGAQVVNYKSVPPQQMRLEGLPPTIFNFISMLNEVIEEQGVSTSTLGKIPAGIKAARAIESLKESEFANLVMQDRMLKLTVQRVAERLLDYADRYFINPRASMYMEKGEPTYFDIIGKTNLKKREQLGIPPEGEVVPISKDYKVKIETQSGLGYTEEGKKQAAMDLGNFLLQLIPTGIVPPGLISEFFKVLLETFQFGPTGELLEQIEDFTAGGQMNDQQLEKMKIAILEALKDAGEVGEEASAKRIDENKLGTVEALQESGIADKILSGGEMVDPKTEAEVKKIEQQIQMEREKHDLEMEQMKQEMEIKGAKSGLEMDLDIEKTDADIKVKKATVMHSMHMKEKEMKQMKKQMKKEEVEDGD